MIQEEVFTGKVTALAFGGKGIVRHEGLVVFVPFTAPGDTVKVWIARRKKAFAEGHLLEVIEPGPARCAPVCPYYGVCGGCQLQHLNYEEQLKQKRQFILDSLQRIGGIKGIDDLVVTAAEKTWAYRRHVRLTLRPADGGYEAGYVREDLTGVLPVEQCPIFLEPSDSLLGSLQQMLRQVTPVPEEGAHVSIIKCEPGRYALFFQFSDSIPSNLDAVMRHWLTSHREVSGIMVEGRTQQLLVGDCRGYFDVDGLKIQFSPRAFVQCHPEQSLNMYREVLRLAQSCQPTQVLDLYCGIGVTALLVARTGSQVTGVEANPEAVELAAANAALHSLPKAQFLKADVARVVEGLLQQLNPNLLIANPPRTGLDPRTREAILRKKPANVIYVSCMPPTLARDLGAFVQAGYRITSCRAYDMFPQTTHVETVVSLQRS